MRTVRKGFLAIVVSVGVVALGVYLGFTTTRGVQQPVSYWLQDADSLGVIVVSDEGIDCFVASVTETATTVKVDAQCNEHWLSTGSLMVAVPHAFEFNLDSPLASRVVTDGTGTPATLCEIPTCS